MEQCVPVAAAGFPAVDSGGSAWKSRWHAWQVRFHKRNVSKRWVQPGCSHTPLHRKPVKHVKTTWAFAQIPADAISGDWSHASWGVSSINQPQTFSFGPQLPEENKSAVEKLGLDCCILTSAARFPCTFPFRDLEDGCVSVLPPAQVYFFAGGNPLSIRMITRQPRLLSRSLVPDFLKTWTLACQTSWLLSAAVSSVLTKWQQQNPRLPPISTHYMFFCSHCFLRQSLAFASISWHQSDAPLEGNFGENLFCSVYIFFYHRKIEWCHPQCRPGAIKALIHPEIRFWGVVEGDDALLCAGWKELPSLGLETG